MLKLAHVSMFQASFFALWLLPLKWSVGAKIFVLIFGLYKLRNFSELKLTNLTSVFALTTCAHTAYISVLCTRLHKSIIFFYFLAYSIQIFLLAYSKYGSLNRLRFNKFIIIWDFNQKIAPLCTILQTDLAKSYLFYKECIDKKWTFCY